MRFDSVFESFYTLGSLVSGLIGHWVCPSYVLRAASEMAAVVQPSAETTAFIDVNVVPMDTERVLANHTVVIEGGRITALGPSSTLEIPAGTMRIDGRGRYLIPGLADMHVHIAHFDGQTVWHGSSHSMMRLDSLAERQLFLRLAQGVTTIRNMNAYHTGVVDYFLEGPAVLRLRARAEAGELWSPRIYTSGPWAPRKYYIDMGGQKTSTPRPPLDSVAAYVAAYQAAGYDFLKIRKEPPEVFDSVIAAARRVGLPVVGHVPRGVPLERAWTMKSHEHERGYSSKYKQDPDPADAETRAKVTAARHAGIWYSPGPIYSPLVKHMQEAGVGLLLGTDRGFTNDFVGAEQIHRDLETLVELGLTPYQALVTATKNPASYFGTSHETGTITVGKRADLVLLNGNPLKNVRYTAQIAGVMVGGRWLGRADLDRRIAAAMAPAPHLVTRARRAVSRSRSWRAWNTVIPVVRDLSKQGPPAVADLLQKHRARFEALVDSVESQELEIWPAEADTVAINQRLFVLLAEQLAEFRSELTNAQRAMFDPRARAWLAEREADGYSGHIPGTTP